MISKQDSIVIRSETVNDAPQIEAVTKAAFKTNPHSDQKEHMLIARLRAEDALEVSLVAEDEEKIIGHIAFSRVTINKEDMGWYGLAPVSVAPEMQCRGIGSRLIRAGLELIIDNGAQGCVLLGEPEYYNRFGFVADERLTLADVPPEYFLVKPFKDDVPTGSVQYHAAFAEV